MPESRPGPWTICHVDAERKFSGGEVQGTTALTVNGPLLFTGGIIAGSGVTDAGLTTVNAGSPQISTTLATNQLLNGNPRMQIMNTFTQYEPRKFTFTTTVSF